LRVYQIARELGRPHRTVLQLMRELGYQVASHMVRLAPEEEASIREAVDRQQRGAPAVRAVHATGASVEASQVAEVVHGVDLEEEAGAVAGAAQTVGAGSAVASSGSATVTGAPPRPRSVSTRPETRPGTAPKPGDRTTPTLKKKPLPGPKKPGRDIEQVLQDFEQEAVKEQIEMVDEVVGPAAAGAAAAAAASAAAPVALEPGQLLRTMDLSTVEEEAPAPQARRRAVVNVGGRQVRTLQRRRQKGPRVSIQASQTLNVEAPISLNDFSQIVGVGVNDMLKRLIAETKQLTWNKNSVLDEEKVKFLSEAFQRSVVIGAEKSAGDLLEEETLEFEAAAPTPATPATPATPEHP